MELFPERTLQCLEESRVFVSPMVLLEMQFLRESGQVEFKVDAFIRDMRAEMGLKICEAPFVSVVLASNRISWTRDPFDRLIVAQAASEEARLITSDRVILDNYRLAFWD
ncbi:MAG: type II toxin-antitoxin system VapC family toxin [Candidatus Omnitrophica bacterium]|nr:type II toxin-antitoxin system VapC family toxin [Candidatus Omnitrophota bacterium]